MNDHKTQLSILQKLKQKAEEWFDKIDTILKEDGFSEEFKTIHSNPSHKLLGIILSGLGFCGVIGSFALFLFSKLSLATFLSGIFLSGSLIILGLLLFSRKKESVNFRYSSEKEKISFLKSPGNGT